MLNYMCSIQLVLLVVHISCNENILLFFINLSVTNFWILFAVEYIMMLCLSNSIWHQLAMYEGSEHIELNKCYFSNVNENR